MEKKQVSAISEQEEKIPYLDPILVSFISGFANNNIGVQVTINIKGLIISGELVSREAYFKGIIKESKSATGDSEFVKLLTNVLSDIDKVLKEKESEKEKKALPNFIHLKNAHYFPGGNHMPNNKGVWWRGRLSEIDGFNLGNLTPVVN